MTVSGLLFLVLGAVVPPLVVVLWPLLAVMVARALYTGLASRLPDLFLRLLAGVGLAVLAGIGTAFLLSWSCAAGVMAWGSLR